MIERFLTWLCRGVEEINGRGLCPTYLYRWTLFQPKGNWWPWKGFGIYVHKFGGDDWSRDMHDHPKRFISIGLWGRYIEWTPCLSHLFIPSSHEEDRCAFVFAGMPCFKLEEAHFKQRLYIAPWIRSFPATHIHRLTLPDHAKSTWTIVFVLTAVREWGFWNRRGRFVNWRDYVKSSDAEARKACP